MRSTVVTFFLALMAMAFSFTPANAEKVRCQAIRDSAMCVSEPTCWYDAANNKGCLPGPNPDKNPCAVHSSDSICSVSALGCKWDPADKKCVSKSN